MRKYTGNRRNKLEILLDEPTVMPRQASGDSLEQKRAVFLLRTLAVEAAARPDLGVLLDLYDSLSDFAVFSVEVGRLPTL